MPVRTGIVGCGIAAHNYHIPVLRSLENAELVAVADTDPATMEDVGDVRKYSDFRKLIDDEDLDSLHVTTPPDLRIPIVEAAAEANASVFLEKPTSFDTDDVDRMLEIRDEHGISICCTQNMRFLPISQMALELVETGEIGDVTAIDNVFSIPKDLSGDEQDQPWVKDVPGGAIGEGAPHLMYTALAFADRLADEPNVVVRHLRNEDFYDGIAVTSTDKSDRLLTMRYLTQSHPMRRLTIHGTDDTLIVDYLDYEITVSGQDKTLPTDESFSERWRRRIVERAPFYQHDQPAFSGYPAGHYQLIKGYVKAIVEGDAVPVPLEDDRDVVSILERLDDAEG